MEVWSSIGFNLCFKCLKSFAPEKGVWSMVALKLGVVFEQFLFVEHDIYLFIQKIGNNN